MCSFTMQALSLWLSNNLPTGLQNTQELLTLPWKEKKNPEKIK